MIRSARLALFVIVAFAGPVSAADDEARLLRFPAIHGDQIVFTYAGDLYTVPAAGGVARRLTIARRLRDVSPLLARTASSSPSPASTTATPRCSSSPRRAASRSA